ncbi:MAG: acetyl-CoA carboxylase carboxyltransferase subunit beta [Chloroflexia bacterium]|nr:acetyl-CoA carboxylase carboxyltransferase subunit beta [Chloroflexia bacterium]MDQ3413265.1 acetyl-CoA carboxylase, carboxyltransferase subunit beta [Chloroflexota bacterium]
MREFFQRRGKFRPRDVDQDGADIQIPEDLWVKCPRCQELVYSKELDHNARVCPKCGYHFRLRARDRIASLVDLDSFVEWDAELRPYDQLEFVDLAGPYAAKLKQTQAKSGEHEALISGWGTVEGRPIALAVCDFEFLGASMGSVFGEKLVRASERCVAGRLPLLTISASGGARMHEGLLSLMQMAKTVAALARLGRARVPHLALLTDPCYGGVTASYATIADIILAEPGAMIGFAGPRVIEQITKQKLPDGFQTAEFQLEHGMVDLIVPRFELRATIGQLIDLYERPSQQDSPNGVSAGDHREPAPVELGGHYGN